MNGCLIKYSKLFPTHYCHGYVHMGYYIYYCYYYYINTKLVLCVRKSTNIMCGNSTKSTNMHGRLGFNYSRYTTISVI